MSARSTGDDRGSPPARDVNMTRSSRQRGSSQPVRASSSRRSSPRRDQSRQRRQVSDFSKTTWRLIKCLRAGSPTSIVMELFLVLQRLTRSSSSGAHQTCVRSFEAKSESDCKFLHTTLRQWLLVDRIRHNEFFSRLREIELVTGEPNSVAPLRSWKDVLTGQGEIASLQESRRDAPGSASSTSPATDHGSKATVTSLFDAPVLKRTADAGVQAMYQDLIKLHFCGRLVAQLKGNMRLPELSSFRGKLRHITNMTPSLEVSNALFKSNLRDIQYLPGSKRLIFTMTSFESAQEWDGKSLPFLGDFVTLHLEQSSSAHVAVGSDPTDTVYTFDAMCMEGTLSSTDVWHLFASLLKLQVSELGTLPPDDQGIVDPNLWRVMVRGAECPEVLRNKTKLMWNGHVLRLHHTLFHANPPCTKCNDAAHSARSCNHPVPQEQFELGVKGAALDISEELMKWASAPKDDAGKWLKTILSRSISRREMAAEDWDAPAPSHVCRVSKKIYVSDEKALGKRIMRHRVRLFEQFRYPDRVADMQHLAATDPDWYAEQLRWRLPAPEPIRVTPTSTFLAILKKISAPPEEKTIDRPETDMEMEEKEAFSETKGSVEGMTMANRSDPVAQVDSESVRPITPMEIEPTVQPQNRDPPPREEKRKRSEASAEAPMLEPEAPPTRQSRVSTLHAAVELDQETLERIRQSALSQQQLMDRERSGLRQRRNSEPRVVCNEQDHRHKRGIEEDGQSPEPPTRQRRVNTLHRSIQHNLSGPDQLGYEDHAQEQNPPGQAHRATRRKSEPRIQLSMTQCFASSSGPTNPLSTMPASTLPIPESFSGWMQYLGAHEVVTPSSGASWWITCHVVKTRACGSEVTTNKSTVKEANWYRSHVISVLQDTVKGFIKTGAVNARDLHRRYYPSSQLEDSSIMLREILQHLGVSRRYSCGKEARPSLWAGTEEIMATTLYFGEPLYVFDILNDGSTRVQMYCPDCTQMMDGSGSRTMQSVRITPLTALRAAEVLQAQVDAHIIPLMMALYRQDGTFHFNGIRLSADAYVEWTQPDEKGNSMAERLDSVLSKLGIQSETGHESRTTSHHHGNDQ